MFEDSVGGMQASFVRYFANPHTAMIPRSEEDLARLEAELPSKLPDAYTRFLMEHGPVHCPTVLRLVLEFGLEQPDLRQFLTPAQALQRTRESWQRELPADLYIFATDCMGNPFCFRRSNAPQKDAPVFFLSPQHEGPMNLAESFDALLGWYVEHVRQVPVPLKH